MYVVTIVVRNIQTFGYDYVGVISDVKLGSGNHVMPLSKVGSKGHEGKIANHARVARDTVGEIGEVPIIGELEIEILIGNVSKNPIGIC